MIVGVSAVSPDFAVSQDEVLRFVLDRFVLNRRTKALYRKVFSGESVLRRRFCLKSLNEVLDQDPDRINRRFERNAVELSTSALNTALEKTGTDRRALDFLAVSTCTGYLCPGIASRLIESCALRRDTRCVEVAGMGCGSAVPAMELCHNFLLSHPEAVTASVSTEICSASFCQGESPDLVISNSLFADGSAAVIMKGSGRAAAELKGFTSRTFPEWRDSLKFTTQGGLLRNVLGKEVPRRAGEAVKITVQELLSVQRVKGQNIRHWIVHPGGSKVLDAVRDSVGLTEKDLLHSRNVLRNFGNLSSASVLFVLDRLLSSRRPPKRGELGVMVSFGAGFSVHACLLTF